MGKTLVYKPPPQAQEQTTRRVYILPTELVQRIHEFGYANGHPSEVAAVRALLDSALTARAAVSRGKDG
jgi:hypothetical protein